MIQASSCVEAILANMNGVLDISTISEKVKSLNKEVLSLDEFSAVFVACSKEALPEQEAVNRIKLLFDALSDNKKTDSSAPYHEIYSRMTTQGDRIQPAAVDGFFRRFVDKDGYVSPSFLEHPDVKALLK